MIFSSKVVSKIVLFAACTLPLTGICPPAQADDGVGSAYERGSNRMAHGNFDGAASAFSEAIGMNNQNALAYVRRGECYFKLNNYDKAIKDFSKAIEISPSSSKAYLWRGTVNGRAGNDAAAIEDYKKAISLDPRLALNFFKNKESDDALGSVHPAVIVGNHIELTRPGVTQTNDSDSCVRDYKAAMAALFPNGTADVTAVADEYKEPLTEAASGGNGILMAEQKPARSEVVRVFPGADEYHGPDIKAALTELNDQIRGDASNSAYFYQRAKIYQKMMRINESIRDYNTAISLEPNRAQYYVGKASLFYQLNKPMKVQAILQKAHSVDPTVPGAMKFAMEPYPSSFKWSGSDE